jgi:hypothetical protein
MTNESLIGQDLHGSGRNLIQTLSQHLSVVTEEFHESLRSRYQIFSSRFEESMLVSALPLREPFVYCLVRYDAM